jgi:tripartite-type tricarboxylate transporter receptor subunit TctC
VSTWYGILTRSGVARPVIETLNGAINRILRSEDIRSRFATLDAEAVGGTVDEFAAFIKAERAKWGAIVRAAGIKAD